ncbi:integrase core domain protein, partial [Ostertagia ostertagi]
QCGRHRRARRPVSNGSSREVEVIPAKWLRCRKDEPYHHDRKVAHKQKVGGTTAQCQGEKGSDRVATILSIEPPRMLMIKIEGHDVLFELDTGASMSIIDERTWRKLGAPELRDSGVEATAYNNERIKLQGQMLASVEFAGHKAEMELHVFKQATHPLCGRDMIKALQIDCGPHYNKVHSLQEMSQIQLKNGIVRLLQENKELFEEGLGKCTSFKATLKFKEKPTPKFFRARPVPIALRPKVEAKLQELVANGSLRAVDHSQWATPLVVVPKPGGKIRICGDYKITVNPQLDINQYPLPKPEDLFHLSRLGRNPIRTQLHPWEEPERVWQRVHMDFCDTTNGSKWLVLVDAKSKWPEVIRMGSTTAGRTAVKLKEVFSRHGLPEQLVSDNGPPFTSKDFKEYCEQRGIQQIFTPPYHPNSNGEAERFVQTFKNSLYKGLKAGKSEEVAVSDLLLEYRVTPHVATGKSPAELLMGRRLRTVFDIKKSGVIARSNKYKEDMKKYYNRGKKERKFGVGQEVFIRNYSGSEQKWIPGIITRVLGSCTYEVHYGVGQRKVHTDQIKERVIPWECTEDYMLGKGDKSKGKSLEEETEVIRLRRSGRKRKETERMKEYREEKRRRVNLIGMRVISILDRAYPEVVGIKAGGVSKVQLCGSCLCLHRQNRQCSHSGPRLTTRYLWLRWPRCRLWQARRLLALPRIKEAKSTWLHLRRLWYCRNRNNKLCIFRCFRRRKLLEDRQEDQGAVDGGEDPRRGCDAFRSCSGKPWRDESVRRDRARSNAEGSRAQSRERPRRQYEENERQEESA